MNLKGILDTLFIERNNTPVAGLSDIAQAEKYLQQAYEGRYFFELIQNVRDANRELNIDGEIFITILNKTLYISNTGAGFSQKGIEGITRIGKSTKHSQDYIGFKGIGFKSIKEVTENPKIITEHGAVYFDRSTTIKKYTNEVLEFEDVPLFYFPHFDNEKLSEVEIKSGVVTKIAMPLKKGITEEKIITDFSKIQAEQLILLGNIQKLKFEFDTDVISFSINKNSKKNLIEVHQNDSTITNYKYYSPVDKIEISQEVIQSLEGKEKEIFSNSAFVDVSIVLKQGENGQIEPIGEAKLYLFYPLQITSGFRFIIHSYFIVNPERKALRESKLNDFLLFSIGKYIGNEMLTKLKSTKINTNRVLCFKRNNDAKLEILYDSVVAELKTQKFIYDSRTKRYFRPSEIMVADGFDKGLFPDGNLGDKTLIYTDDKEVKDWLCDEFEITYLHYDDIANQIESECKRQLKQKKVKFFQNLYNYVSKHQGLDLTGKKVLLTNNWQLVSSEEDVFYRGKGSKQRPIELANSIQKQIHFIHKDIVISDFREGKSRTGITEFNTYELVRRLLKLFNKSSVPNIDLLNALYNINDLDAKSDLEIREKIILPVKGSGKWLSPLTNPIYFESENLKQLYPDGNFVDDSVLVWKSKQNEINLTTEFLKKFGVWQIPAIYVITKNIVIKTKEKRDRKIQNFSGLSARPFYVFNDRVLDMPVYYNTWFTSMIINNWITYQSFIQNDLLPKLLYSSNTSNWRSVNKETSVKFSQFVEVLSNEKWICFQGEDERYSVNEVVGINHFDFSQAHNQVVRNFLRLLPMDYGLGKDFIREIELVHLNGNSIDNFKKLLNNIFVRYKTVIPDGKDFINFYNRILGKLVDFYDTNPVIEDTIDQLEEINFLSIDETTKTPRWSVAHQIFYIDDKPGYDLLPIGIKKEVQPHFTNRDKNTFGKIAGKIGKRFSRSIEKEIVDTEIVRTHTLVSFYGLLPEFVALLESHLGDAISKHFGKIKAVRVLEKENLEVEISVGNSPKMLIPVSHFIDSDFNIHLGPRHSSMNQNKQIAEAVNEFFINILDRDLRNFTANLLNFLNTNNKHDYLKSYDITEERINEIRDKLNDFIFTPNQKFWEAILSAKKIQTRENLFIENQINLKKLSAILEIELAIIQEIENKFVFTETSKSSNIRVLTNFLGLLSITLDDVNKFIFPKIDFRNTYQNRLLKIKNKFERGFNALLHDHLSKQIKEEKCLYQNHLDNFKINFKFLIPLNTLELDVEQFFLESLLSEFPFLEIKLSDLNNDFNHFDPIVIYSMNRKLLENKLASVDFTDENLDTFLADNKVRSLLYFNEVDSLRNSFKDWLSTLKKGNNTVDSESELEDFLNEFSNQTDTEIEEVSTQNVDVTSGNGNSSAGNGRRFDGGANDQFKKRLGLIAEMVVFEKLKTMYDEVTWVSKYASKIYRTHSGYNPEGQDGLGYDIEYLDSEGNKYFVEVKGKGDIYDTFEITKNEIEKAHKEGNFYKLILVTQIMDNSQRRIRDLGNLFILADGEDFFSNSKFSAIYRNFEIRFKEINV
ncbi:DUF3883 domain-containing protein [Flavobacterium sp. Fl-318]|uniref:DUF3883 domain-containing protein n=1 Tax=Flavobacterium cupriresistens TaxID=2893885 RepID=A0ABU4R5E1_9FLAO|nr:MULTISPECIES: DUF3883 domain-containing protein [unclassified Flavobacterium]MDX6187804.1 DUF3883 domain-containing protein [Flavobacterium sp. Fl-318]UFH42274.1 DUF3883 domain-containing protein [Flavobacterium sp. F-323]